MGRFCLSVNTLLYRTSRRTAFGVRFKERLGQVQQGRHNPLAPLSKTHSGRTAVYGGIKKNSTWVIETHKIAYALNHELRRDMNCAYLHFLCMFCNSDYAAVK